MKRKLNILNPEFFEWRTLEQTEEIEIAHQNIFFDGPVQSHAVQEWRDRFKRRKIPYRLCEVRSKQNRNNKLWVLLYNNERRMVK